VIKTGNIQSVQSFLKTRPNIDVNIQTTAGQTPLYWATELETPEIAEYLILNGARLDIAEKNGFTPLHLACHLGRILTIQILIKFGSNPNGKTNSGMTPLHIAVKKSNFEAVKMLIEEGRAAIYSRDNNGRSVFDLCSNTQISDYLKLELSDQVKQMVQLTNELGVEVPKIVVENNTQNNDEEINELKEKIKSLNALLLQKDIDKDQGSVQKRDNNFLKCVVCESDPRNVLVIPCMHLLYCPKCSDSMITCRECGTQISGKITCNVGRDWKKFFN